jgi:hypothetical protein
VNEIIVWKNNNKSEENQLITIKKLKIIELRLKDVEKIVF